jgi:hypothetical protein
MTTDETGPVGAEEPFFRRVSNVIGLDLYSYKNSEPSRRQSLPGLLVSPAVYHRRPSHMLLA